MARRAKSRSGGRRRARSRRRGGVMGPYRYVRSNRLMTGRKRRGGFGFGNILKGALMGGLSAI